MTKDRLADYFKLQITDTYRSIASSSSGEYKDRGSKFIAYAFPVATAQDWAARLEEVRKLHPKARHYCFAFRLGTDGQQYRANDDGEPAGSAGRPILGQIDSFGLTNVFVVVVRYFGGTLLGVPGLIAAYKGSTQEALSKAEIREYLIRCRYQVEFDYSMSSAVMQAVKKLGFEVYAQAYSDTHTTLEIGIRKSDVVRKLLEFKSMASGLHLEAVEVMDQVQGLDIRFLEEG